MSTETAVRAPTASPRPPSLARRSLAALACGAVAVVGMHVWGRWLQSRGHRLWMNWPPLVAHLDVRAPAGRIGVLALAGTISIGAAAVAAAGSAIGRLRWRSLLACVFVAATCWAAGLALYDGTRGLLLAPAGHNDYLHDLRLVGAPGPFLHGFVDGIGEYTTHVRSHPPGMVLLLWAMDRVGLSGPWWVVAMEIGGGAAAAVAALVALRDVAGERAARIASPFLAFTPAAVTIASSGDAFFAGVGAWAVALVVLATRADARRGDALALAGGMLFGATIFLSYGLALLAAIPVVVALYRRRGRPLVVAAVGTATVAVLFLAAGFSWVEGLLASRLQYLASVARDRPYSYFVVADLVAFAIAIGPAVWIGLASPRDRRAWILVSGALVAVALADVSGMSKAEVERIWLPFLPWVALAASAIPERLRRIGLVLSLGTGLALEALLSRPW